MNNELKFRRVAVSIQGIISKPDKLRLITFFFIFADRSDSYFSENPVDRSRGKCSSLSAQGGTEIDKQKLINE